MGHGGSQPVTQVAKEPRIDPTPLLGGQALVYRRVEGGNWYVYLWLKAEKKRFRKCLETSDKALAIRTAEAFVLDALARQQAGQKVLASSLAEVIDKWEQLQHDRLARGEIRSSAYIRQLANTFRKQLGALYGLETPISALKQEDWDRYVAFRGGQGVALDTIRVEVSHIRGLVKRVGMKLGARLVPELNVYVPKHKRSRRSETFTADEFEALKVALDKYVEPDIEGGLFVRSWSLGSAKARAQSPNIISQDLERSRRQLLRWFVRIASASGCRPHELTGEVEEAALRWRDVEIKTTHIQGSRYAVVGILRIRAETKTGSRSVPSTAGLTLGVMREWSRFSGDDDYVFADQYGIRAGKPVYLDALRLHWREVIQRMNFKRFKPDLYSIRHFWATQRLLAGAPPVMVAKSMGHSLQELLSVYEHLFLEDDIAIRQVWKSLTPVSLQRSGVMIADCRELESDWIDG